VTRGKRAFDIGLALVLGVLLAPLIVAVSLAVLIRDGRPVLFASERMKSPEIAFTLWKFRTMAPDPADSGVSGGDKHARITPTGAFLRAKRLDELPQLWNILKGDMSFVGPRPPLRSYVERFPDLYRQVLKARPGVTGLATLVYHRTEERLLAETRTAAETDAVYARRCVPRKARLDLIQAHRQSVCADAWLAAATVWRGLSPHGPGRRARRRLGPR
jgi:lipopolysaccharide/colanic/teichoic acid biosynthesis glycosyltransferase